MSPSDMASTPMRKLRLPLSTSLPLPPQLLPAVASRPRFRRLAPYYYLLSRHELDGTREEVRGGLRRSYLAALGRNVVLHRNLGELLDAFREDGVPVIPLKGTLLSLRLYGELGRPTADIDLFVRLEDVSAATRTLERAGYSAGDDPGRYDIIFHRSDRTAVELHRSLGYFANTAEPLPAAFWRRAQRCTTEGHEHWQLDVTDEFLYLCLNLVRHRFVEPFLALDLHLAVEKWGALLDWKGLGERAAGFGLTAHVAAALEFARHWFGTAIPEELLPLLRRVRWKTACLKRLEWNNAVPRLVRPILRFLPYRVHFHLLFHLLLLAESWGDRRDHVRHASTAARRIICSWHDPARCAGPGRRTTARWR